ncbi:MAG: peptidase M22 [Syntrophomonadaceae bacterium]|nr:peptidase M22 [Syntrophomonadaceae bacterium]
MSLYLGIDTSAYTSSLALVDKEMSVVADERITLEVKKGQRGLRQSEALFLHIKNLPHLFASVKNRLLNREVEAVAVSAFPRRVKGSYMPVFIAGVSLVESLSCFTGTPLYKVSHQEGHIMAGMQGNRGLMSKKEILAVHFSGGTSEILHVKLGGANFLDINTGLSSTDLHAGQLIDRVGVAMGLSFPAGKELEKLALQSSAADIPTIPSSVSEKGFSFSGAETRALSLIKSGVGYQDVAYAVLRTIANTLEKSILLEAQKHGLREVLLVGGVMANSLIRQRLLARLEHPAVGLKLHFAEPSLSTDNAVGVAMLAAYLSEKRNEACETNG